MLTQVAAEPVCRAAIKELIVIDGTVVDRQVLLDGLGAGVAAIVLEVSHGGVQQITTALANYRNLRALHLISHGEPGQIFLGNESLSSKNLSHYAAQLKTWQVSLADNADILIYGCQVAGGKNGAALLTRLHELTGANIAATKTLTGNAKLGGNWDLEVHQGTVNATTIASCSFAGTLALDFTASTILDTTTGTNSLGVSNQQAAFADLNNDGKLDFVLVRDMLTDLVFLGNGDGTFNSGIAIDFTNVQPDSNPGNRSVNYFLEDLNGDNSIDAIVTFLDETTRVLLGNGDGTFADTNQTIGSTQTLRNDGTAIGDINGDGDLDILQLLEGGSRVYLGNGDDHFTTTGSTISAPSDLRSTSHNIDSFLDAGLIDFDRDDNLDLVLVGEQKTAIFRGDGSGGFTDTGARIGTIYNGFLEVADFNNDGFDDFYLSGATGPTEGAFYLNNGTFNVIPFSASSSNIFHFRGRFTADIDNANGVDFVQGGFSSDAQTPSFLLNDGSSSFTQDTYDFDVPVSNGIGVNRTELIGAGDVDGDGDLDVIASGGDFTNDGNFNTIIRTQLFINNLTPTNNASSFNDGVSTTLSLSEDSNATSLSDLLDITDADTGDTLTWSISGNPSHGSLSGFSATGTSNGGTVTPASVFYTPTANYSGSDRFVIQVSDGTETDIITVNVTIHDAPEVSSLNLGSSSPTHEDSLTFDIIFSEGVTQVGIDDFSLVTTGTAFGNIADISGSGSSYTLTVNNVTGDGTLGLNLVDDDSIVNGNGVALGGVGTLGSGNGSLTGPTYTLDNTAPTLTSFTRQPAATSPTNADALIFRATFSEAVQNVNDADFAVTGTTAGIVEVTGSGAVYDIIVAGGDLANFNGTVGLDLAIAPTITDQGGNALTVDEPATDETYIVDNTAPTVTAVTPSLTTIQDGTVGPGTFTLTVDFNEAMNTAITPTIAFPTAGEDPRSTITFVSGDWSDADTYVATYNIIDANERINDIDVQVSGGQDRAGNSHTSSTQTNEFSLDMASAIAFAATNFTSAENVGTSHAVTLTRTGDTSGIASVQVNVTGGTAMGNGTDYTSSDLPLTVNFAAGETSKTVAIPINNDLLYEASETIALSLGSASNATLGDLSTTTLTITDNDAQPSLSIGDATVDEGAGTVSFVVSLSAPSGQPVTVDYATSNGTAIAGSDYVTSSGTLTFAAGETHKTVTVGLMDDSTDETVETFRVALANATNAAIVDAQGQGTITDNDAAPTLSISDSTVNEDAGTATFTVNLSAVSGQAISVNYATADGTATAGTDYTANIGMLNFAPGETSKTVTVNIADDGLNEAAETFEVTLLTPMNAVIADGIGQGTITDNDAAPTISVNDVLVSEGDTGSTAATFTLSLSAASGQIIRVNYATADGTATTADNDYIANSGIVTFNPDETTKTVEVLVVGDTTEESDEAFFFNLTAPTNATLADNQGIGTVQEDDILTNIIGSNNIDNLVGTPGKDRLVGNEGADALTGGSGDDQFVITDFDDRQDTITDFTPGEDRLNLVLLFDEYNITAITYTDASAQGYLAIISDGASGSIVQFDRNGTVVPSFLDSITPEAFIRVQGIAPTALGNDANFVLQ